MKNKILLVFLFTLLIPVHFSSAYIPLPSSTDLGGSANPINIQIQPDYNAQRRQENLLHESQLKIQYGYSIYSSCKSSVCGSYNAIDPFSESSCLSNLESWLGRGLCQAQKDVKIENLKCNDGYVKINGECVTYNQSCNLQYPNTIFLNYNGDGKRVCDCKTGYVWNEQKTSCVVSVITPVSLPVKNNDQICNKDYGVNSIWTNKLNDTGGPICDCKIGYQFNQGRTQCIIIPKAEVKAVTPTTIKAPEVKAIQNEIKKDITTITKSNPVSLNKEVATSITTEVKPKSFWTRLKGWFGF